MSSKYKKNFKKLAHLMGIPVKYGMVKAIAAKLDLSINDLNNWIRRGVPDDRIEFFESAGYPLEYWWTESDADLPQISEGSGIASKASFHDSMESRIQERQPTNKPKQISSAIEDLIEIFESGDPYLIPLIHSNLVAAKQAVQAHKKLKDLEEAHKRIRDLEKAYTEILKAHAELSNEVRALKQRGDAESGDLDETGTDATT
jgi:site-specific recombinase